MAAQHALGLPGGAGGEQDVGDVLGCHPLVRRPDVRVRQHRAAGQELRPRLGGHRARRAGVVAQDHHALQLRQRFGGNQARVVGAEKFTDGHQQARAAAAQDEAGLLALQARVERYDHGAHTQGPQRADHPLGAIGSPERDPVAGGDSRTDEGGAGGERLALQLAETQLLRTLDDRRGVAEHLCGASQHTGQRRRAVGVHTLKIANHTVRCDPCSSPRRKSVCQAPWSW